MVQQKTHTRLLHNDSKSGVLYAFKVLDGDGCENTYKVGKSVNLKQRIRSYKTLHPENEVLYHVQCVNMNVAEKWVHDILKAQGKHVSRELFMVDPMYLKTLMCTVAKLSDVMVGYKGSNTDFLTKLYNFLR